MINIENKKENDKTVISICPKCSKVPNLSILFSKPGKLKINCSCSKATVFSLKDYISQINKIQEKTTITIDNELLKHCTLHKENENEFYCKDCDMPFCKICFKSHECHCYINLTEMKSEINIEKIQEDLSQAEKFINIYQKKIKENYIKKQKDKISIIEDEYNRNYEINSNYINLIKILLNTFISTPFKDYNTTSNLFIHSNINLLTIENLSISKYPKLFTHLNKYFILKERENINHNIIKTIKAHTQQIKNLLLLNDGRLASCSDDKTIRIFNTKNFLCEVVMFAHNYLINYISQLDSGLLLSCSHDKTVKIWSISEMSYQCVDVVKKHEGIIWKVIPLPNNKIASCSSDRNIVIMDSEPPYNVISILSNHINEVYEIFLMENNNTLISGSADGSIIFWDIENYKQLHILNYYICCCYMNSIFQLDERRIVIGEWKNNIHVISIETYQIEATIQSNSFSTKENMFGQIWDCVTCFCYTEDEMSFLCGCPNGDIVEIDKDTYKIIRTFNAVKTTQITSIVKIKHDIYASSCNGREIYIWGKLI